MIGNTRLWNACLALATHQGDVRSRVVIALQIIDAMHPNELDAFNGLKARLDKVKIATSQKGTLQIGSCFMNAYENTARQHNNKTYVKYAKEIFEIWLQTLA